MKSPSSLVAADKSVLLEIKNTTKKTPPRLPYELVKEKILGKKYELSLVFCSNALSRSLNATYRKKDKATNVLSFPLSETSGEIFINLNKTKDFSILHLFIHGLLHLKGMEHGDTMELRERKLLAIFSSTKHGSSNRSRH